MASSCPVELGTGEGEGGGLRWDGWGTCGVGSTNSCQWNLVSQEVLILEMRVEFFLEYCQGFCFCNMLWEFVPFRAGSCCKVVPSYFLCVSVDLQLETVASCTGVVVVEGNLDLVVVVVGDFVHFNEVASGSSVLE